MNGIQIDRLTAADLARARELFLTIAAVFETEAEPLSDAYLARLLSRPDFWALSASLNGRLAGGLTAHALPLTRVPRSELLIYDIAVVPDCQRQGIGGRLVSALRAQAAEAGIEVVWVPADNEDTHALDFYHAIGGEAAPVTIFTFGS